VGCESFPGNASRKASITHAGAIAFAVAGFTFWVFTDTSIKLIGQSGLPIYEIVAFLGLFMALFLGAYSLVRGEVQMLRPRRIELQLARACLDLGNNLGVVIALRHLSLTLFYILVFTAPMAIALLSALFLREGLHWRKTLAIVAGFAGVIVAIAPWGKGRAAAGHDAWIGILACVVCVACFSTNMVWSRVLTRTESPISLAFFSGLVTAAAGFALMLFRAAPLSPRLTAALVAMGMFGAAGTLCFYIAVKHTSAANVSQYHYTQLLTGALLAYLIWHDKPGFSILLGGSMILGSGLYIAISAHDLAPLSEGN
jgi:drug/metabolite transporter (DMT)-like permease